MCAGVLRPCLGLQEGRQGDNHTAPRPHPANPGGPSSCQGDHDWLRASGTHPARAAASPASSSQLYQTKARAASKATKKLDGIAHWLADKAKSWGISTMCSLVCLYQLASAVRDGSHRPQCTSICHEPGWQSLKSMRSMVTCALPAASSTYHAAASGFHTYAWGFKFG